MERGGAEGFGAEIDVTVVDAIEAVEKHLMAGDGGACWDDAVFDADGRVEGDVLILVEGIEIVCVELDEIARRVSALWFPQYRREDQTLRFLDICHHPNLIAPVIALRATNLARSCLYGSLEPPFTVFLLRREDLADVPFAFLLHRNSRAKAI